MSSCFQCNKCFQYAKEMKVSNLIANMMAFARPQIINYDIEDNNLSQSNERGSCYQQVKFIHRDHNLIQYPWIALECYKLQKCKSRKKIIVLRVRNINTNKDTNRDNKPMTLLFSHGNSCDLSSIYSFMVDLSTQLKCDIICYDYSGYGRSEGSPSEKEIYSDVEEVMEFMIDFLKINQNSIILVGNSLGSAPTVHIAVKSIYSNVKGIILISPISSGMKLFNPNLTMSTVDLEKCDIFCNLSKVVDIKCPVFLIHGIQDDVIPQTQSLEMMNKIKHVYEWFPRRGNHHNIFTKYRSKFFLKVKLFLEHLKYSHNKNKSYELQLDDTNYSNNRITQFNKIKQVTCEENYIQCETRFVARISSPIKMTLNDENGSHSQLTDGKTPTYNCVSVNKGNFFEMPNSNDNIYSTKSVENEAEHIFSGRMSEYYYNYKDAKELEHQFNQIQKKISN